MATISNNDIAKAIYLATKGKTVAEQSVFSKNIVSFLSRRHLLSKSEAILAQLGRIINFEKGIIEAKVMSAKKLDEKTKKGLTHVLMERYSAKDVTIEERIDEKLIGGLRIEVEDEVLDLTIKNKIGKLKEYLTKD